MIIAHTLMNLDRLQDLKQKLMREPDFSNIWLFYMDEFADHPEFTDTGEAVANPFLEEAIPKICQKMFKKTMAVTDLLLISIPEHQFFHAPFLVEGRIGGVIYFADINMGLIAVAAESPPTAEVKYSRFSNPFTQGPDPHVNN
jgi:hypothetical protein